MWSNPQKTYWRNLLKKSLMENFIFCTANVIWKASDFSQFPSYNNSYSHVDIQIQNAVSSL